MQIPAEAAAPEDRGGLDAGMPARIADGPREEKAPCVEAVAMLRRPACLARADTHPIGTRSLGDDEAAPGERVGWQR